MTDFDERAARALARLAARDGRVTRRGVLRAALTIAAAATLPRPVLAAAPPPGRVRFTGYPFALGVASGYPRPDGFTLWTRLAPAPLQADGGMAPAALKVTCEVARDERFAQVVHRSERFAAPELAHSAHVDVQGLEPGRWYWYRFTVGDEVSPVGRTRTADAANARVQHLRFAIASCQHFEQGYFAVHRHLVREDVDLLLFLGDYLYENTWGDDLVREHVGDEAVTLADYRIRYAQYRSDVDLQRTHAAMPWAMVWDDHEVENDWAGSQSEFLDPAFLTRRAAAFQAYFEHMPMPLSLRPQGADARIYTELAFGDLARFYLLDDRQYRTPQACPDPVKGGGSTDVFADACAELADPARTMFGAEQERWLDAALGASRQRWNVLAQQTLFAPADSDEGPRRRGWTDSWDGYPAARKRLVESLKRHRTSDALIVGGDLHATFAADIHGELDDGKSPIVATEFCGTSIVSQGWPAGAFDERLRANPHLHYGDGTRRGYLTFDLTPKSCEVAVRNVVSEKTRDTPIATTVKFAVESGKPGVRKA